MTERHHYHASIECLWNEDPPKYVAAVVKDPDGTEHRWSTGNPVYDWACLIEFLRERKAMVLFNSSLSDFVFDVPGYRFILDEAGHEWLMYDPAEDRPGNMSLIEAIGVVEKAVQQRDDRGDVVFFGEANKNLGWTRDLLVILDALRKEERAK